MLKRRLCSPNQTRLLEQFRQSVEASDELLYRGDLKELSGNILDDITAELGDAAPARLSELSEALLEKIATSDPAGATRIQRAQFLAASTESGLIKSLNSLHSLLAEGKVAECQNLLKSIGKFFQAEIKADQDGAKARETAQTKATEKAQREIQTAANKEADQLSNRILGAALGELMRGPLKSLDRTALVGLASSIKTDLHEDLKVDKTYQSAMDKLWKRAKSSEDKAALLAKHEAKLRSIAKTLVSRVNEATSELNDTSETCDCCKAHNREDQRQRHISRRLRFCKAS